MTRIWSAEHPKIGQNILHYITWSNFAKFFHYRTLKIPLLVPQVLKQVVNLSCSAWLSSVVQKLCRAVQGCLDNLNFSVFQVGKHSFNLSLSFSWLILSCDEEGEKISSTKSKSIYFFNLKIKIKIKILNIICYSTVTCKVFLN